MSDHMTGNRNISSIKEAWHRQVAKQKDSCDDYQHSDCGFTLQLTGFKGSE